MLFHPVGLWFEDCNDGNDCALTAEHAKHVYLKGLHYIPADRFLI